MLHTETEHDPQHFSEHAYVPALNVDNAVTAELQIDSAKSPELEQEWAQIAGSPSASTQKADPLNPVSVLITHKAGQQFAVQNTEDPPEGVVGIQQVPL